VSQIIMDFTGADSIYTIDKSGPVPKFSADGNSVSIDGVKLNSRSWTARRTWSPRRTASRMASSTDFQSYKTVR
jgi:hypothetical protein